MIEIVRRRHVGLASLATVVALGAFGPPMGSSKTAVFAGGCFWGVEAVFEHVKGVKSATSGYAVPRVGEGKEGTAARPGYAEAVRVTYDSTRISYEQLLRVFLLVAHDPTQLDRQGPDVGPQYRSIVFVEGAEQRGVVNAFIDSLRANRVYARPIVTEIAGLRSFRIAEDYHQDFVARHPSDAYVVTVDRPKLEHLRQRFPELYRE